MKVPSVEFTMKAGMLYTGLKTILHSVGLENNKYLGALIQYISLFQALSELIQEEIDYITPHLKQYGAELYRIASKNFMNYFKSAPNYNGKISILCQSDRQNITLKHQQKFFDKICHDYSNNNSTNEHLFTSQKDTYTGLCLILGDESVCKEILQL